MGFLSLLPFIGPLVIWMPAAIIFIINGINNSNLLIIKGVVLLFYGFFVMTTIDNILKPKIIGSRVNINPVVVFIGVLGGIYLMGLVGVIIGPLILVTAISFSEIYLKELGS